MAKEIVTLPTDEELGALVKAGYRVEIHGDIRDPLPFRVILSKADEETYCEEVRRFRLGSTGFGATMREALDDARSRIASVWIPNEVSKKNAKDTPSNQG